MPSRSPIRVATDERGVITGATGTGKTTFVRALLLPAVPRSHTVVIIDPKSDKAWRNIPSVTGMFGRVSIKPKTVQAFRFDNASDGDKDDGLGTTGVFQRLLHTIWDMRNVLIISDETAALYPNTYSLTPMMGRIIREGRQRGIGVWWLTQRPSQIPMPIVTESEWAAAFTLRYRADRIKMAQTFGDELETLPPQEAGRSHYFYWARLPYAPRLMRLTLGGHTQAA
jgi:DNA helicase HerA-like ATPase